MNEPIVMKDASPTLEEYIYLCSSVGWTDYMNFHAAEQSLRQSLFSAIVKVDQLIIGMGRIVGDGAIYFYIQDIIVHPDFQGRGIGREIMDA
ncbi:hypothetical protein KH172YL63_20880 [Bacillus sp. KH172YL63]|nr:hypothetical protein KH172YL63_20880 [Bacillus sp. KH172YL63]